MASTNAHIQSKEPQGFLKLPPELRDEIYTLAIYDAQTVTLTTLLGRNRKGTKPHLKSIPRVPGIIHTCHQTRNEAIAIYFSVNNFRLLGPSYGLETTFLGEAAKKHLRDIAYEYWLAANEGPYTMQVQVTDEGEIHIAFGGSSTYRSNEALSIECTCGLETSLRTYARSRQENTGGKMGFTWAVALGFECRHLMRLQQCCAYWGEDSSLCGGCGKPRLMR